MIIKTQKGDLLNSDHVILYFIDGHILIAITKQCFITEDNKKDGYWVECRNVLGIYDNKQEVKAVKEKLFNNLEKNKSSFVVPTYFGKEE